MHQLVGHQLYRLLYAVAVCICSSRSVVMRKGVEHGQWAGREEDMSGAYGHLGPLKRSRNEAKHTLM
jgi:hypothetical protein